MGGPKENVRRTVSSSDVQKAACLARLAAFCYIKIMTTNPGYHGKTNWSVDRKRRKSAFQILADRRKIRESKPGYPEHDENKVINPRPKGKFWWVFPVLGAIVKVGVFIFIFYAAAMFISHGKRW